MKVYLLEHGQFRQGGEVLGIYQKLSDCLTDYDHYQDVEERKAYNTITYGLDEYDKTPGCIFGFWSGPSGGNTHFLGWRVREIDLLEKPWY